MKLPACYDRERVGIEHTPFISAPFKEQGEEANLTPAPEKNKDTLLLGVDVLKDFFPLKNREAPLPVEGSVEDQIRLIEWGYQNTKCIDGIMNIRDRHRDDDKHIFRPCWWEDRNGNHPQEFQSITALDVKQGKWIPVYEEKWSVDTVIELGQITIWPKHCVEGSKGAGLIDEYRGLCLYLSHAKEFVPMDVFKGGIKKIEHYGGFKPERLVPGHPEGRVNLGALGEIRRYKRIVVFGEALDYCVLETLRQIFEYFKDEPEILSHIYLLIDCTSMVDPVGNKERVETEITKMVNAGLNVVKTTSFDPAA